MMDDLKTDLDLEDEKVTGIDCLKAENSLLRHQLEYHQKYIIPDKYIQYANSLKKQLEEQKTFYENELNQKTKAHTQAFQIEMINQSRLERYWEIESEHLKKVIEEKDLKIKQDSEQMKKTIEEKDFQLKQSGQLIDKLKQRINDSQNEMDKLEDDYNKANIVIETLENQRISLVENHNYIMSNPILAELIGAHLRSKSINQQITYSSNNDSIINKNNADTLSIKRESLEVASPFLPYRRSGLTKNRKRKKRRSKLYETKKEMREVEEKLFRVREECAHYTEHDTQDGKKYYFNAKLNQSVWDKPKCLSELTELESKLEELRKKKIEKPIEQSKPVNKEKDVELTEEEKAKQKSKPVSSTAVPGTPWCVVWTRDKRVFFYNPSEKISLWERPQILVGRLDVDKMVKEPPANAVANLATENTSTTQKKKTNEPNPATEPPQKKHKIVEDDEGNNSPKSGNNSPRHERSGSPSSNQSPNREKVAEEFLQKDKIEASKEAALEAEAKAAQVRAQLPLEQRIQQFKDMLIEKDVSAYSTWEKELQKIVFDPRYLLLTSKERKQVFDKYVKDRANQESKERAAALKKKRDDFKDLLKEANISLKSSSSSFTDFASKYARDERFKGIEKMKDRESIFNDYLSDLRKQEKEEKYAEKEKLKKNFYAMLKEFKSLHRHSSWSETKKQLESDPRYKAIDSSSKREDYFRDYCKYLDEKPNGDSKSSHKDKQKDKSDDKSSKHSSSKMDQDDLDNSKNDGSAAENEKMDEDEEMDEDEKRKELEKQERVSASLRERNKEVKEQLSRIQNEREKERDQLKRDETIECFKALLIDIIKPSVASTTTTTTTAPASTDSKSETSKSVCTTELSWKEAKKILKRDSRWSYCKLLEKEKKEQLFEEHMNKFRAKKREIFYQLLDETSGVSLSSTWKEVKKLIKADTRYEKLQQSDSLKLEKEFENYISEKYQRAKQDFKELLMQTKLITYKSLVMSKESAQHLKDIEDILSKDKSYEVLECAAEERKKMLLDYIEQLHNEGPPPPPTATEPARRK